ALYDVLEHLERLKHRHLMAAGGDLCDEGCAGCNTVHGHSEVVEMLLTAAESEAYGGKVYRRRKAYNAACAAREAELYDMSEKGAAEALRGRRRPGPAA